MTDPRLTEPSSLRTSTTSTAPGSIIGVQEPVVTCPITGFPVSLSSATPRDGYWVHRYAVDDRGYREQLSPTPPHKLHYSRRRRDPVDPRTGRT